MKNVLVYSMKVCPYCLKAKALLTSRGVKYTEEMIDDWSDEKWDDLVKKSGMKTAPQIFAGEQLIGGYTQLAELDTKDQLKSLL
jgi:glutaredoxin 3